MTKRIKLILIILFISFFLLDCTKKEIHEENESIKIEVFNSKLDTMNRTIYFRFRNISPFDIFIPIDHISYSDFFSSDNIETDYSKTTFPVFKVNFKNQGYRSHSFYYFYEDYYPHFLKISEDSTISIPIRLQDTIFLHSYINRALDYYLPFFKTNKMESYLSGIFKSNKIGIEKYLISAHDIITLKDSFYIKGKKFQVGNDSIKIGNNLIISYPELIELFVVNIDTVVRGRTEIQVLDD